MGQKEIIRELIKKSNQLLCDDCLSVEIDIKPRQTIYQKATSLYKEGLISRETKKCSKCGSVKIVSLTHENEIKGLVSTKPWYWEGNVQAKLVNYLNLNNIKVQKTADTATKESGKDIVAIMPNKSTLWVSVKGWPEKSVNTQARHWFSQAIFDMVLYKGEVSTNQLALAFPDGYSTYLNLAKKVNWFLLENKIHIYWIAENGFVRIQESYL